MKIAVDARELCGCPTGVGRYLGEIVREWGGMPEAWAHEFVLCAPEPIELAAGGRLRTTLRVEPGHGIRWEQVVLPRLVVEAGADVIFAPGYSGPICGRVPLVVAIHDVSFAAHPEWFRWREGLRRRWVTRASAQKAARIVTISEFSRREISEHLGVPLDRIDVIPPGIRRPATTPVAPASAKASAGKPVASIAPIAPATLVLYVGSLFNRRHVPELMEGFARLAQRRSDARLAIVGENRTSPRVDLEQLRQRTTIADRIELMPYLSERSLDALYRDARAFAFLSEYEGFGLTPAEALARGVPIVVLDTPVAREVYGAAAIYVPRAEPVLVEQALEQALYDDAVRSRILQEAHSVLARYSWRDCAERVLRALIESGHR